MLILHSIVIYYLNILHTLNSYVVCKIYLLPKLHVFWSFEASFGYIENLRPSWVAYIIKSCLKNTSTWLCVFRNLQFQVIGRQAMWFECWELNPSLSPCSILAIDLAQSCMVLLCAPAMPGLCFCACLCVSCVFPFCFSFPFPPSISSSFSSFLSVLREGTWDLTYGKLCHHGGTAPCSPLRTRAQCNPARTVFQVHKSISK